jgi:hypothetical protein
MKVAELSELVLLWAYHCPIEDIKTEIIKGDSLLVYVVFMMWYSFLTTVYIKPLTAQCLYIFYVFG